MRASTLAIALAALLGATPAAAIQIPGSPSCGMNGTFACEVAFSPVSSTLMAGEGFEVDVVLEDMQHIELFDSDTSGSLSLDITLDNSGGSTLVNVRIDVAFSDQTGAILDALDPVFINVMAGNTTAGTTTLFVSYEDVQPILFHDVHLTLTASGGDIELGNLSEVAFGAIDDTSSVGMWIPEPGTSVLVSVGLLVLALGRRVRAPGREPARRADRS